MHSEKSFWSSEKNILRAKKYAHGDFAEKLKQVEREILDAFEERVAKEKKNDAENERRLKEGYQEFQKQADDRALKLLEELKLAYYGSLCDHLKKYTAKNSLEALRKDFAKLGDYKDTNAKLAEIDTRIARIEKEQRLAAEEKAKREAHAARIRKRNKRIKIIVASVAIVAITSAVLAYFVIIPNGKYNDALALMKAGKYYEARAAFIELDGYKDSNDKIAECNTAGEYNEAVALMEVGKFGQAIAAFKAIDGYKDSHDRIKECYSAIVIMYETVSAGDDHIVGLKSDGTVVAVGDNIDGQRNVSTWTDIVAVSAGYYHTVGLKADGTVVVVGYSGKVQIEVSEWSDIKMPTGRSVA